MTQQQYRELDQTYYEEGGDSDADAFAIVSLIVILAAFIGFFLQG